MPSGFMLGFIMPASNPVLVANFSEKLRFMRTSYSSVVLCFPATCSSHMLASLRNSHIVTCMPDFLCVFQLSGDFKSMVFSSFVWVFHVESKSYEKTFIHSLEN